MISTEEPPKISLFFQEQFCFRSFPTGEQTYFPGKYICLSSIYQFSKKVKSNRYRFLRSTSFWLLDRYICSSKIFPVDTEHFLGALFVLVNSFVSRCKDPFVLCRHLFVIVSYGFARLSLHNLLLNQSYFEFKMSQNNKKHPIRFCIC